MWFQSKDPIKETKRQRLDSVQMKALFMTCHEELIRSNRRHICIIALSCHEELKLKQKDVIQRISWYESLRACLSDFRKKDHIGGKSEHVRERYGELSLHKQSYQYVVYSPIEIYEDEYCETRLYNIEMWIVQQLHSIYHHANTWTISKHSCAAF